MKRFPGSRITLFAGMVSVIGCAQSGPALAPYDAGPEATTPASPTPPMLMPMPPPSMMPAPRVYSNEGLVEIIDAYEVGVTSAIHVPDRFAFESAIVDVAIDHPFANDLELVLTHGDTRAVLFSGGGAPYYGLYQQFRISGTEDLNAQGTWTLTIVDHNDVGDGTLISWGISFTEAR